jgi:hypothetical protein
MIWTKSAAIIPNTSGNRRTDKHPEQNDRNREDDDLDEVGRHHPQHQRQPPDWTHQHSIEIARLDVGHDRVGTRDAGNGKDDRGRELESPVVEPGDAALGEIL